MQNAGFVTFFRLIQKVMIYTENYRPLFFQNIVFNGNFVLLSCSKNDKNCFNIFSILITDWEQKIRNRKLNWILIYNYDKIEQLTNETDVQK